MSHEYRVVKLQQNRLYPTYQLHAYMANKKTAPQDGLRLAGLIVMDWLRQRLGDHVPPELQQLPEPSSYLQLGDDCLPSIHINSGFVADIVSLPEQGIWSMQITEPDLGSDPGNPNQLRQAIPGRVIETNIGFRVKGQQLECGFQTVVSDPEGTESEADVYRLVVVRRLIDHPDFGLQQVMKLGYEATVINTVEQIKNVVALWRDVRNQLPGVIFTHPRVEKKPENFPKFEVATSFSAGLRMPPLPLKVPETSPSPTAAPIPYDVQEFAKYGISFCRSYELDDGLFERAVSLLKCSASPGDILILEPTVFGGNYQVLPYKPNPMRQADTMESLRNAMYSYPRGKAVDFGNIAFLSAAREGLLHSSEEAILQTELASQEWIQKLDQLESQWKSKLQQKDDAYCMLSEQLERQKQYQDRLEQEKESLVKEHQRELDKLKIQLSEKDEEIAYLKRKLGQPREHKDIAAWVEQEFAARLILHPKAVALLEDKSAKPISCSLICDALDFLATDYWASRYERMPRDEMLSRCSEKYGRPFEVKPTGSTTIEFTPSDYKIKYFPGARGKPVESPLDFHLGVGNDPENLLRIYFLHDDKKQRIVVGSLPRHLRAVTIK